MASRTLTQRKAIGAPARRTSKVPKNLLVNEPRSST
jgi:hypothetical protein